MKKDLLNESLYMDHLINYEYGDSGILTEASEIPEISEWMIKTFMKNQSQLTCIPKGWRFPAWVALETGVPVLYVKLALGIVKRESGYGREFRVPTFDGTWKSLSPITRWGAKTNLKTLMNDIHKWKNKNQSTLEKYGDMVGVDIPVLPVLKSSVGPAQLSNKTAKELGFTVPEIKSNLGALLAAAKYLELRHNEAKKSGAYNTNPSSNLKAGTGDSQKDIIIGSYNAGHTIITKWCVLPKGHKKYKEGKNYHAKCKLIKKEDLPWTREELGLSTTPKTTPHPLMRYMRGSSATQEQMGAFGIRDIEKGLNKRDALWRKYVIPHLKKKGWDLKKSMDYFYEQDKIWRKAQSALLHHKSQIAQNTLKIGDVRSRIKNGTIQIDEPTIVNKRKNLKNTPNYIPNYETERADTGKIYTHGYVKEVAAEFKRLACLDKFKSAPLYVAPPTKEQLGPGYVDPNANRA